jgi:hypothetical protein
LRLHRRSISLGIPGVLLLESAVLCTLSRLIVRLACFLPIPPAAESLVLCWMFLFPVYKCSEFDVRRGFVTVGELSGGIRTAIPVFRQRKLFAASESSTIDVHRGDLSLSANCLAGFELLSQCFDSINYAQIQNPLLSMSVLAW